MPVVVARRDLPAGERIPPGATRRLLTVRQIPQAFVPPGALVRPAEAAGLAPAASVPAGGYLTAAQFRVGASPGPGPGGVLRAGERAIEVAVAGGETLAGSGAGGRVDVLVSTESGGRRRTFVALEDVELLELRSAAVGEPAAGGEGAAATATAMATLRVTARQAVYLTAAHNFARELRLVPRPPGDRRRTGAFTVSAGEL
jgi:pilus assembly protein CpaB